MAARTNGRGDSNPLKPAGNHLDAHQPSPPSRLRTARRLGAGRVGALQSACVMVDGKGLGRAPWFPVIPRQWELRATFRFRMRYILIRRHKCRDRCWLHRGTLPTHAPRPHHHISGPGLIPAQQHTASCLRWVARPQSPLRFPVSTFAVRLPQEINPGPQRFFLHRTQRVRPRRR